MNIKKFKKLKESLSENTVIPADHKTTSKGEGDFYSLLVGHPHFLKEVTRIRKKLNIPEKSYKKPEEAYLWEHQKNNKNDLYEAVKSFISDFKIPRVFKEDIEDFMNNFILCEWRVKYLLDGENSKDKAGVKIINASLDREINAFLFTPGKLYLEITPETTSRDIDKAFKKITKKKKDKLPYNIYKSGIISRTVWEMSQSGNNDKKIKDVINEIFDKDFNYQDIPVYRKRHKDRLKKLCKIDIN